ncbi:MAG TPA: hypothetical protein VIL36_15905 [Acidimicrobiales bacterium]
MILAELELFHSRPIAPTRRVALGHLDLPVDPAPGFGGLLLGGVVAANIGGLDPDLFDELDNLTVQLERGQRVAQPRLRHRLQADRVGLQRSVHRLVGVGEELTFELEGEQGSAAQHILAAVYAAALLPHGPRTPVMEVIRKAMRWAGEMDHRLVTYLSGVTKDQAWSIPAHEDPITWALDVLGLRSDGHGQGQGPGQGDDRVRVSRRVVQRRFRDLVRRAHPDHGGDRVAAAARIAELSEARRILLQGR